MAATKITDLSATTTLGANDLFVVVTNPSNAPATKKVKAGDVLSSLANIVVSPATTTSFGTVKIGDNLYLNSNNALSANLGTANTGDIVITGSVISTTANDDIVITSNNEYGISIVSNDYVQMVYSQDGSYWGGGNNQSYVYLENGGIYNYIYRYDGVNSYWSEHNIDPYGTHSVYGWNGSYSYEYVFESTNASTLAIKPSPYFNSRIGIEPSMDYDIHIYEVNTRAGILIGKPEESFISVYGPGGNNGGAGLGGNNIVISTVGTSPVSIRTANSANIWNYNSNGTITFPDYSIQTTAYQTVAVPNTSIGQSGDKTGMISYDNSYMYYCSANYNGIANIWKRVAWSNDTW